MDELCISTVTTNGPVVWYSDGRVAARLDSGTQVSILDTRDLRLAQAMLTEALDTVERRLAQLTEGRK